MANRCINRSRTEATYAGSGRAGERPEDDLDLDVERTGDADDTGRRVGGVAPTNTLRGDELVDEEDDDNLGTLGNNSVRLAFFSRSAASVKLRNRDLSSLDKTCFILSTCSTLATSSTDVVPCWLLPSSSNPR